MGDIRPTVCVFAHGGARGDCSVRRQLEAARDVSGRARPALSTEATPASRLSLKSRSPHAAQSFVRLTRLLQI